MATNPLLIPTLNQAITDVVNLLNEFADDSLFTEKVRLVFGVDVSSQVFKALIADLPEIEVVGDEVLQGALGAFSTQMGKIYLSQGLVSGDTNKLEAILIEEIGHYVDAQINPVDSPGDEGAIFSAFTRGVPLTPEQIQFLESLDDNALITLDGQTIQVEQSSISDSGGEGGTTKILQLDPLPAGQQDKGSITVKYSYEHFSIPDQFTIRYEGKNVFDTGGLVSGSRSGSVTFERGNSDIVEIIVTAPQSGTAWEFSVSADDCAATTPLNIEAVGGDFKDNDGDGDCEFNGTITIGRTDGTAKLIRIEGASVEYDKKEVRVKNGTVFPTIGGISKPLFRGDFTIPFAEGKSSSFAESGKSSAGFKLGGLDVDFNKIILDKNAINLGASFALPLEIAENPIRVSLTPDSSSILDIPNGLIIDNSGLKLGSSGGVKLPNVPKNYKLFNLLKVATSDLNISYSNSDDVIKLQGKVELSPFSRTRTSEIIVADLTGTNFIQVKDGNADFVGSISVKNIPLIKGWDLPELKLFLDTTKNIVEGDVSVKFPFGKQPVLFERRQGQVGIGVGFQDFELNSIRGNLALPAPGLPIAATGFFIESLGGGITNLAPSSKDPTEFTGDVKINSRSLGRRLVSLDASVTISSEKLSGSGKLEFINKDIVSADVSAELDWNKEKFSAKGYFSFFDGLLKANTGLELNSNFDFITKGKVSATIPKAFRGKKIPLIGGEPRPSISFLVDYKNDSTLSNDFGAIWGSFPISVPGTSIQRDVSVGLKVFFDGDVDVLFGSKLLPETNSFQVAPGSQYIILSADWENSNPNVKVRIKKPDGSFIDEADFAANNISIFAEFTDEDTRSVVIANPTPGIWDIVVVDPNGLGEIVYSGIGDSVVPTIEITSPTTDITSSGIVNIGFNAVDSDSRAKIKLFYDDDNIGLDGLLITDSLLENDGDGTFAWNTEGVPTGDYFIYAMIMDDENIPVFSNYSVGKIKVTESADLELDKVVFGNDPITNSNFTYQLSVTNNGTSISKDVVLQDSLPTEVTFISASTIPSQQTGSDLTFNLGDIAPGTTKTVDITVKSPTTALTLLNAAEVSSKTFDPFIGDNFATLSTNVNVPPTPLTDLSVTANSDSTNLKIGDRITYDFVVTNNGTANASGVVFQTNFTANAGGVQNLSANIGRVNRDVVTANLGSLASGQSRTVSVSADLTAAGTLTTTADVSGNELDPSTLNNSLILQKNVEAIALVPADLELSLTSDKTTANIDDIVTFRLTLTNKGTGAATSIKVKQVLASGLTFVSSSPQQGTYDSVSGIWDAGNIAKDNQAFVDIVTKVTSGGSLSNTAEVIAVAEPDPDSTPNNNNPNEDDQASVIVTIGTDETPGNLAPTDLALSATTVNENVAPNTVIGTFSSTDPDTGNSFTYSLVAGTGDTDNTAFSIVGNQLQINNSPDFETKNSYSIRVKTTDQGGLGFEKVLVITVNDLNETPGNLAPTDLTLSATTVNENVAPNTVIGTFSSTDPDTGNSFTYSLIAGTGDTDNTAFSIVGNQLQINNSPDFETKNSYSIRVKTTDQGGLSFEKVLVITVNDVNETPGNLAPTALIFQNAVTELAENVDVTPEFKVADLLIEDDGLGTNNLSLTGRDRERFLIQNSALFYVGFAPNFEAQNSYEVTVNVDDPTVGVTPDLTQTLTLNITDVNEAPTALILANSTKAIAENSDTSQGVKVADIQISDDALGTNSLSLLGNDQSSFQIRGRELFFIGKADFEAQALYNLTVAVTDTTLKPAPNATPDATVNFTLEITNLPDQAVNPQTIQFNNTGDGQGSLVFNFSDLPGSIQVKAIEEGLQQTGAFFNNVVGLYPVADDNGAVFDSLDLDGDGNATELIQPSQAGYARTALSQAVNNFILRASGEGANQSSTADEFGDVLLEGGRRYAPFVIANGGNLGGSLQGSIQAFLSKNPDNVAATLENYMTHEVAYFSFGAANPDGAEHLRSRGNNIFGFEDLPGNLPNISDNDFNDGILAFNFIA
ncbi:MAG: DUF11 domain-containing protein [Microcystis aeruginosa LL13-06]|nr:DUF11 domain-containing protein [Microcystis aeruginosa LL13-06]